MANNLQKVTDDFNELVKDLSEPEDDILRELADAESVPYLKAQIWADEVGQDFLEHSTTQSLLLAFQQWLALNDLP
jgi:hypothetical protein